MDRLRLGLVGAGRMGKNHARVFSTLRNADLIGVCDQNADLGMAIARQYDTRYFANVSEMIQEVDAVSIATPTPTHFDLAMQCLEAGRELFVEKPIAETLDQAERLAAAANQRARIVQVGHIERFNPAYVELKHVLEGMTVVAVNFQRLSPYSGSNTDVDVILDLMIHDLDLLQDLMGAEPVEVAAQGLTAFSGAIDHVTATIRYEAGPLLAVTASRVTEQKVRRIDATALEAYVDGDLLNKTVSVHRSLVGEYLNHNHSGVKYRQESVVERIHVPAAEPLFLELQHFVECVQTRRVPAVTADHGVRAMRLAMQIQQQIEERIHQRGQAQHTCVIRGYPILAAQTAVADSMVAAL